MFRVLQSKLQCSSLIQSCKMAFYAVARGRKIGIYESWTQCENQVKGFKGAAFKKFATRREAQRFITLLGASEPTKCPDFWPDDVAAGDEIAEDELIAAINEVEGFPVMTSSLKRKADIDNNLKPKIYRHMDQGIALKQFGELEFILDAEGYVIVYTDGSCLRNGRSNACAGIGVFFGDNHKLNAAKPVQGRVTNNVGEIQAAILAIKTALTWGIPKLCINTDSQFLINSITQWVQGWKKRGWCLRNMEPVKNVADFKELDGLLQTNDIKIKWNYVPAHKGIRGNEMADKLAKQGSQMYRKSKLQIKKQ